MKIFVAVLALVLIASSQGSLLFRGEPQSKWEEAIEDFWTFTTQVSQATEAAVIGIKSSELDQQFQGLISDSITELNASLDILRAKLGPYADKLNTDLSHLRERLQRDMGSVKTMLLLYNEEAQLIANQKAGELRQSLNLYLRKYRKRLNRDSEEIRKKFQAYSQDLRAKGNRTLEDLREMLEPHTRAVGEKLQERLDNIQQVLTRQAEEVRSKAEVLQGQVSENAEQLRILLRQRMEEIRDWFEAALQIERKITSAEMKLELCVLVTIALSLIVLTETLCSHGGSGTRQSPPEDDATLVLLEKLAENGKRLADRAVGTVLDLLTDRNKQKLKYLVNDVWNKAARVLDDLLEG